MHHLNASNWPFESQSALTFSKHCVASLYCYKCAMLQMWLRYVIRSEGCPIFRFSIPTLLCSGMLWYLWTEFDENFTLGIKSPVDFKYGVRIDVGDPQPRQPLGYWLNQWRMFNDWMIGLGPTYLSICSEEKKVCMVLNFEATKYKINLCGVPLKARIAMQI